MLMFTCTELACSSAAVATLYHTPDARTLPLVMQTCAPSCFQPSGTVQPIGGFGPSIATKPMRRVFARAVERIEVTFVERTEGTVPSPCTSTECPVAFSHDDDESVNVAPAGGRSTGSAYAAATASVWPLPEATKSANLVNPAGAVYDVAPSDDEAAEAQTKRRSRSSACVSSRATAGVVWVAPGLASKLPP